MPMPAHFNFKLGLVAGALLLSACGGGGGGGGSTPTPSNTPPTANAGADQSVTEGTSVTLAGSGADSDGTISSYAWTQVSGPSVTLSNANTASASFTAPDVSADTTLEFKLTVTDNGGATATDTVNVTVHDTSVPGADVTINVTATYDSVPHNSSDALDYAKITQKPIRGAIAKLLRASDNTVIASAVTDAQGKFSFTAPGNTNAYIEIDAEMKQGGTPSWDFTVVDNTSNDALYSLTGSSFNTGSSNQSRTINAASGWGGTAYTGTRSAAPFAILDAMYTAYNKVLSANPQEIFPALKLNWSVNNRPESGDTSVGQIGTSYYSNNNIFILGAADNDTDEFDDHVIIHEWGHYFEDNFARADSIGGSHGGGDYLDMRVAFGEGWGNAWSGIATDNPLYQDSYGTSQSSGFHINVDSNNTSPKGWFSEASMQSIIYDLYDGGTESGDTVALGFGPIYTTLTQDQKITPALTSIFPFITSLKARNPASASAIDTLVSAQQINSAGIDIWGSNETNNGGNTQDVLPIYLDGTVNSAIPVCVNNTSGSDGNKLANYRYVHINIPAAGTYTVNLTRGSGGSDPDFEVYQKALIDTGYSGPAAQETKNVAFQAGDAVIAATESGTHSGRICMSLSVSQQP